MPNVHDMHPLHEFDARPHLIRATQLARTLGCDPRTLLGDAEANRLPVALPVYFMGRQRTAWVGVAAALALVRALNPTPISTATGDRPHG